MTDNTQYKARRDEILSDILMDAIIDQHHPQHPVLNGDDLLKKAAQALDELFDELLGSNDDPGVRKHVLVEYPPMDERDKGWYEGRNSLRDSIRKVIQGE